MIMVYEIFPESLAAKEPPEKAANEDQSSSNKSDLPLFVKSFPITTMLMVARIHSHVILFSG